MPELPEVQTTVNGLNKRALGRAFLGVWTDAEKMVKKPDSFSLFKKEIREKKIENVRRVGKNIIFGLSEDYFLLVHQKLTGHLLYGKWQKTTNGWQFYNQDSAVFRDPMNKFIHFIFFLDDGYQIALSDLRKFAKIELAKKEEVKEELLKIGPDPLKLSPADFKRIIGGRKGKIKTVLMKQELISGIGNIYSDEALFRARISPLREANSLTDKELEALFEAIRYVLKKGIELGGESISDYRNIDGEKGKFDPERKVYRKTGQKCPICGTPIKRIVINGRSAHFCPVCQK